MDLRPSPKRRRLGIRLPSSAASHAASWSLARSIVGVAAPPRAALRQRRRSRFGSTLPLIGRSPDHQGSLQFQHSTHPSVQGGAQSPSLRVSVAGSSMAGCAPWHAAAPQYRVAVLRTRPQRSGRSKCSLALRSQPRWLERRHAFRSRPRSRYMRGAQSGCTGT
jgi:hypothetical protein